MLLSVPLKVFVSIGEGRPMMNAVSSGISGHFMVFTNYMIFLALLPYFELLNISSMRIWCHIQKSYIERKRSAKKNF